MSQNLPYEINIVKINNVEFNKYFLNDQDYFKGFFNFNKDETEITLLNESEEPFSYYSIVYLKKKLYCQKIEFKLETVEDVKLIIELEKLGDLLQICIIKKYQIQKMVNLIENLEILKIIYTNILGLLVSNYTERYINTFEFDMKNDKHINLFAFSLKYKDPFQSFKIYKLNWEVNKNMDSLFQYAYCLLNGQGCKKNEKKAFELFKMNWEENKCSHSLYNYALCLMHGECCKRDDREACRIYKMNWEENNNTNSLNGYANCVMYGFGCEKDEKKACELYKINWEENKNIDSLYNYAIYLVYKLGSQESKKEGFRLFKMNWEENKCSDSLYNYALCLMHGTGCEKDEDKALNLLKI